MRRAIIPIVAIALAAAPLIVSAQQPVPERGRMAMHGMQGAPLSRILAQREALGLSEQQVRRIEEIRTALDAQNQPLLEQLRLVVPDSLRPRRDAMQGRAAQITPEQRAEMRERMRERVGQITPEQRAEMRERMRERRTRAGRAERPRLSEEQAAAVRPIAQQLRENAAQALRDAHAVLTPEQQKQLRERPGAARFHGGERGTRRSPAPR